MDWAELVKPLVSSVLWPFAMNNEFVKLHLQAHHQARMSVDIASAFSAVICVLTAVAAWFNTSNLPAVVTKEYDDICNDIHPIWYYLAS